MQSEDQVLSGLTGALVIEGIGKFNEKAAKLPERIFCPPRHETTVRGHNL